MYRAEWIRRKRGVITGTFIAGYAQARIIVEFFRQPDTHIGFLAFGGTIGQWLSVPMLVVGIVVVIWSLRQAK